MQIPWNHFSLSLKNLKVKRKKTLQKMAVGIKTIRNQLPKKYLPAFLGAIVLILTTVAFSSLEGKVCYILSKGR